MDMTVSVIGGSKFQWDNRLLTTADGGESWSLAVSSPIKSTAVRFVTPEEGWMIGNPLTPVAGASESALDPGPRGRGMRGMPMYGSPRRAWGDQIASRVGKELYVTRNGANSWDKVSLETPKEVYSPDGSSYPPRKQSCGTVRYPDGRIFD